MKELERGSILGLNSRGFRWAEIDSSAFSDIVVLAVEADTSFSLHQVNQLMFVGGRSIEFLTRF